MKKNNLSLLFLTACCVSIFSQEREELNRMAIKQLCNMAYVNEKLFIDETEISNEQYRGYVSWLKEYQPENMELYHKALPDTLVWRRPLAYNEPFVEYYFRHPGYDAFPVVGVSPEQIQDFCQWRLDRLKEQLLVRNEKLAVLDPFEYGKREEIDSMLQQFNTSFTFRLPTSEEWEEAARAGNKDAIFPWKENYFHKKNGLPYANSLSYNAYEYTNSNNTITTPIYTFWPNKFGIYGMGGNVAEIVTKNDQDKNYVLKGGSWMHADFFCLIMMEDKYYYPTDHIGFRCVFVIEEE